MYNLYKNELLSQYKSIIINTAIRVWKKKGFKDIPKRIESLEERLSRAKKKEFIAIYHSYLLQAYFPIFTRNFLKELAIKDNAKE